MRGQAWIVAAAGLSLLALAPTASAQGYGGYTQDQNCAQDRNNRALIGGVVGGVAGAVVGRQIAARNARTEGALLGGLAGAAAGAVIGNNTAACQPKPVAQAPYGGDSWGEPGYSGAGGYQQPGYGDQPVYRTGGGGGYDPYGGRSCRWGEMITRDPEGRERSERIHMCRGRDGVWRPS
jgi:hypothetical protein